MNNVDKSEEITVSPAGDILSTRAYDRKSYYDSMFSDSNDLDLAVHIINVFIVNSDGQILLQKRSPIKRHNPGLIDKSLGGHVVFGDSPDYSVMVETVQELLTPSIVLSSEEDFSRTHTLLNNYSSTVAIVRRHDTRHIVLSKKVESKDYAVPNVVHLYFGVYNGSTKPADREAAGTLYYTLEDLRRESNEMPQIFTDDLKTLIKIYGSDLQDFIDKVRS